MFLHQRFLAGDSLRVATRFNRPSTGMNESQFADLLMKADYSEAKGLTKDDILKHKTFESIGDGRYLVRVGPGYVQSDKGPFVLDLGSIPAVGEIGPALGGAAVGAMTHFLNLFLLRMLFEPRRNMATPIQRITTTRKT